MRLSIKSIVAVVVAVVTTAIAYSSYHSFNLFQKDLVSFEGFEVGQSKIDAQYAQGIPDTVQGPFNTDAEGSEVSYPLRVNLFDGRDIEFGDYESIPEGQSSLDFDQWHYRSQSKAVDVDFDPETGLIQRIQCWSHNSRPSASDCQPTFGIAIGMGEAELIDQLGRPDSDETSGGGQLLGAPIVVVRRLEYHDLGLEVYLQKRRVSRIAKVVSEDSSFWNWLRWSTGLQK